MNGDGDNGGYPRAPSGWFSASGLSSAGYKQSSVTINRKLADLQKRLVEDVESVGFRRDIAAEIIEHHLIGKKKPAHGRAALHASPEAIALLERDGALSHKWDNDLLERGDDDQRRGFSR